MTFNTSYQDHRTKAAYTLASHVHCSSCLDLLMYAQMPMKKSSNSYNFNQSSLGQLS